jgi:RimJ/RimL family protein N-acetyltransferase
VHDLRCAAVDGAGRLVGAGCVEGGSLSYFVDPCFWGRGIATALATHLCRLALSEHPPAPVVAWVERDNRASERVLEKCRFRFAGLYRHGAGAARAPSGRRALLRYELHP